MNGAGSLSTCGRYNPTCAVEGHPQTAVQGTALAGIQSGAVAQRATLDRTMSAYRLDLEGRARHSGLPLRLPLVGVLRQPCAVYLPPSYVASILCESL